MAKKEANFDLYIHDLLVEAGICCFSFYINIIFWHRRELELRCRIMQFF